MARQAGIGAGDDIAADQVPGPTVSPSVARRNLAFVDVAPLQDAADIGLTGAVSSRRTR